MQDIKYIKYMRTFNERNELRVNNNRSFIDNPNLFLMTRFI